MYNPNQPRESDGKFAGGHAGENEHRQPQSGAPSGRYPVVPHAGARSVASHTGFNVSVNGQLTHGGRRRAVAETIAKGLRVDNPNAMTRVKYGR